MNLKFQLIVRIVLIAWLCLLATAAYVLHQAHAESGLRARLTAEALAKQLEFQLLRINAGFGNPRAFPDLELWQAFSAAPGICVSFATQQAKIVRSACIGDGIAGEPWPSLFADTYRWLFRPDTSMQRPIVFNHRGYGMLNVTASDKLEIAQAYTSLKQLLGLSSLTVLAVCLLVYFSLADLLRPARAIVAGLVKMRQGDLTFRLPDFALREWRQTADAINQLAQSQLQLLQERERLALKLLAVQEQERGFLAHELHDEFGQCLAAINALTAAIGQTAAQQCPALLAETEQISGITQHIMANLRGLLLSLRPVELSELGLAVSLSTLVQSWTARSHGQTVFHLAIHGDPGQLPEPLPMTVYRIVQECLTNAAKHASASEVGVTLDIRPDCVVVRIADNGIARHLPFVSPGIGLLGIEERVGALGGKLEMSTADTGGLMLTILLPICTT